MKVTEIYIKVDDIYRYLHPQVSMKVDDIYRYGTHLQIHMMISTGIYTPYRHDLSDFHVGTGIYESR